MKIAANKSGLPESEPDSTAAVLREPVSQLRRHRTELRAEWARRITEAGLLTAMSREEIFAEATSVYDNRVEALETGTFEALLLNRIPGAREPAANRIARAA